MGIMNQSKGSIKDRPLGQFLATMSNKMAFIIAISGGLVTAIFTMMIPISALETFTGASGLSEIIPATAAPLGSSAKTLFVIFTVILASSALLVLLLTLRKETDEDDIYEDDDYINERARERNRMALARDNSESSDIVYQRNPSEHQNLQTHDNHNLERNERRDSSQKRNFTDVAGDAVISGAKGLVAISAMVKSRINTLPFMGGDDSIRSYDDLPKLRDADKHPDAPARRPLSANEDLGERILDKGWGEEDGPHSKSASKTSDHNHSFQKEEIHADTTEYEMHIENMPKYENISEQKETDQIADDIHLQSLHVRETSQAFQNHSEEMKVEEQTVPIELNNNQTSVNNDKIEDVSHDVIEEHMSNSNYELPSIVNLMDRLEVLVERRAKRVQAREGHISEINQQESTVEIKTESDVKREIQLDDYADVIDDVAINRAKKMVHEKNNTISEKETLDNTKRPTVKLVSERVDKKPVNAIENGDTIVTKSQKAEMDNALKSALETLHKMTERSASR